MATETRLQGKRVPRGTVRFSLQDDGKTLDVHVDRKGFRRLLQTLERLAETGVEQRFDKSGRGRPKAVDGSEATNAAVSELVFHIENDR